MFGFSKMMRAEKFRIYILITFTVICWGYSPIGIHSALASYSPQHIALLRFLVASLFLLLLAFQQGIQPLMLKDIPALTVLGLFSVTLHHLFINIGQQYVTATATSIIGQAIPLFTVLISAIFLKQPIRFKQWFFIGLGLIGASIVVLADRKFERPNGYSIFILLAALAWAIYFNLYQKFALNYDALSLMCYVIWLGTIPLLFYGQHVYSSVVEASWQANLAIILLGIFPSALAHICWGKVLNQLPVSQASHFLYCTPMVAIIFAVIFLHELPSWVVLFGGMIIISSVILMNTSNVSNKS